MKVFSDLMPKPSSVQCRAELYCANRSAAQSEPAMVIMTHEHPFFFFPVGLSALPCSRDSRSWKPASQPVLSQLSAQHEQPVG